MALGLRLTARGASLAALAALIAGLLTIPVDVAISSWIGSRSVLAEFMVPAVLLHGFFLGALIGPLLLLDEATQVWRRPWLRLPLLFVVACVLDRLLYVQSMAGWGALTGAPEASEELFEALELYQHFPISAWCWEITVGFALTFACWQRRWPAIPLALRTIGGTVATFAFGLLALTASHLSDLDFALKPGIWSSPPWWEGLGYNWAAGHALAGVWLAALLPGLLAFLERSLPSPKPEDDLPPGKVAE